MGSLGIGFHDIVWGYVKFPDVFGRARVYLGIVSGHFVVVKALIYRN